MYGIGFLESNTGNGFIMPNMILTKSTDVYFFDVILKQRHYVEWDYRSSIGVLSYIKQISKYKILNSFKIKEPHLRDLLIYRKQAVVNLIESVKNRKFEYNEEDTSTWVDNFISIEWEGEKVFFSYETPDGELLWGLYCSLEPLQKEIALDGALCMVCIDED